MHKKTLSELVRLVETEYVKNEANWLIVEVQAYDNEAEIIINPRENFSSKIHYYSKAYSEDLILKNNANIKIINYNFVEAIQDYF